MDRGAWWAILHGIAKAGHKSVTKQQQRRKGIENEQLILKVVYSKLGHRNKSCPL